MQKKFALIFLSFAVFYLIGTSAFTLEIKHVYTYDNVYNDIGTGATQDLSVYRPKANPQAGFYNLGHIFTNSREAPEYGVPTVRDRSGGALAAPIGWTKVWDDTASGGAKDGSVWNPECPSGFVPLGSVAIHMDNSAEATNDLFPDIRCLHESLAHDSELTDLIYTNSGSSGTNNLGVWAMQSSPFALAKPDYDDYSGTLAYVLLTVEIDYVDSYDNAYDDIGTGAREDLSVYRPRADTESGWFNLGHIFTNSRQAPDYSVPVIKDYIGTALAEPIGWKKIWDTEGSKVKKGGSVWDPICPKNYISLGSVAAFMPNSAEATNDDFPDIRCLLNNLAKRSQLTTSIYKDKDSRAKLDLTVWAVEGSSFAVGKPGYGVRTGEPAHKLGVEY